MLVDITVLGSIDASYRAYSAETRAHGRRRRPTRILVTSWAPARSPLKSLAIIGRLYLWQVKKPDESKGRWDYYKLAKTIPVEDAWRPLDQGGCSFVGKRE